ncbi:hypothetical protein RchiOBHm_Chr2g0105191 [Rosa chinensis]|uniref:FBD domain-containing protein n=1 Tax=Rosa chinensis TaxID=74649 RepID=A0A2P6RNH7_ROSCH|nr:hypothetical protein RchiOBHm_Chr2g0105191 [Rosa chinensis]
MKEICETCFLEIYHFLLRFTFLERLRHDVLEIAFRSLSFCLSKLEILKLNCTIVWPERDFVIPLLPNPKRFELAYDEDEDSALLHLISFIKESPCLRTPVLLIHMMMMMMILNVLLMLGYSVRGKF